MKITQDVKSIPPSTTVLSVVQLPPNKLSCLSTSRTRSPSLAVSTKKDTLLQQKADLRMKWEEQLILLDKILYEQRIESEKENTRKLKAQADLAELELQIRKRKAEEE